MIRSIFYNWSRKDLMYPDGEDEENLDPTLQEESDGENKAETIFISAGDEKTDQMWLINLPQHLVKLWSAVDEDGRQLATLRIWETTNPQTGCPFMSILVPSEEDPSVMEEYILDTVNKTAKNQCVSIVQEEDDDSDYDDDVDDDDGGDNDDNDDSDDSDDDEKEEKLDDNKPPRVTNQVLAGRIVKELVARPSAANSEPEQHIELLDYLETSMGDELATNIPFDEPVEESEGPSKKFMRVAYDRLLHVLLTLFEEQRRWDIRELTRRTKQPAYYLRKVLPDIATENRAGRHKGKWELLSFY